ncbi:dTDP-4-dehydrorhamnose reductase [Hyphomicrobium sp. CS1GBMeth3]|uniref:dTDP-4-dehydrorhamnose reductase n=1 Tax=Hyphomicrobium sp. CS1GBMeth3 TaxID=1892845 RepID=UPI000931C9EA|nr:dTDP-4-dehydrorhamnose reductase [Hyphomicrobium sp. CS1GBMeth3]
MRIVVTGKTGQIAQSLLERGPAFGANVAALGRPEFDLAAPLHAEELLAAAKPDLIISAAAYTAVDKAESDREVAYAVNAVGPRALAQAAATLGVPVLHVSTDYVFDGSKAEPWREEDTPRPLTVYGASKLAGEEAVLAASPDNVVVRVGWVYSPFSANFAKTILRLAGERDTLRVVADQTGGPSSALDIADGLLAMARNIASEPERGNLKGLFHMSPEGVATWADFAEAICGWLGETRGRNVNVERITTADYPTPARRPANSRLDSSRLAALHGIRLPHWRTSLPAVLGRLAP